MEITHPFADFRKRIRSSIRQYRHNDDTSKSLFHPEGGFVLAYDAEAIDTALEEYEQSLPSEFTLQASALTKEEELIRAGSEICANHPSPEARDFAQSVVAYFVVKEMEANRKNPVRLLKTDSEITEPTD